MLTVPDYLAEQGDPWATMNDEPQDIGPLVERFADDIADMDCNWQSVLATQSGNAPDATPIWYQKHMVQHMGAHAPRDWFADVRHAVLIRHPAYVAASFDLKHANPTAEDLGAPQMDGVIDDRE